MAKIKKELDKNEMVIFRKPNQFLTMNTTGLNRFQMESLNVLLHEAQKSNATNMVYGKTDMNRNKYGVNLNYLLDMISDKKDNRQFKNIVEFIEALSKFRLTSIDNLHGNIESMCVFPSIKYNSNEGYIEYTLEDSIEYCVLNTTFIGESGSKNGNPKKYFTAIDIKPIKYNKPTIDKLTGEVIGYKETSLSVACIGVLNFLIRNMHLWYNDKYGKNTVLELDEDEFRCYANCSNRSVFEDDKVEMKYEKPSELKKLINNVVEEIYLAFGVNLDINIRKSGRIINCIDFKVILNDNSDKFFNNLKDIEKKITTPKEVKSNKKVEPKAENVETHIKSQQEFADELKMRKSNIEYVHYEKDGAELKLKEIINCSNKEGIINLILETKDYQVYYQKFSNNVEQKYENNIVTEDNFKKGFRFRKIKEEEKIIF